MRKILSLVAVLIVFAGLIAGCGGGGADLHRITGLTPEKVVTTFHERAKSQNFDEAALYVSPTSLAAVKGVGNFLKNDLGLTDALHSNILAAKVVGQSGDFAVVMTTLQDGVNSTKVSVKAVGLEKINGEWYIVDNNTVFRDAKYKLLQDLIDNVLS